MQEDGFQIRTAERNINKFQSGLCGGFEEPGNLGGVLHREFCPAFHRVPAVLGDPGSGAFVGARKTRPHLAARAERILHKFGVGALRDDLAVIDDRDVVAQALGFFHIMRGVDDRHAFVPQSFNHFENVITRLWIDASGGLIHQNQLRLVNEAGSHVKAALHASGEIFDQLSGAIRESGPAEASLYGLRQRRTAEAVIAAERL